MAAASNVSILAPTSGEDTAARQRAKERLYVICQCGGWMGLMAMQLVLVTLFRRKAPPTELADLYAAVVQTMFLGLLITHFARRWLHRWGWKDLGWRRLAPRTIGFALLLSFVWCVLGYGIYYGLLRMPWREGTPFAVLFATSLMQGTLMLMGWLCSYFFYHLFDRFHRLEVEGLRLAASVKEAELRALKSQVNPHFIFNSLNSLRALIDEDPARARESVTQLANLLRYSLQSAQSEVVAFEDELRVVNDYLALEQVRHEERLRVRLDVAPDTLGLAIPPLLLQTLVENAVKYGISPRPEGGEIVITARRRADQLELQVVNPGEWAASPNPAENGPRASTGLGLKNAADRLRHFFGDRARLQLRAEGDSLVVAEVSIPIQIARP